MLNKSFPRRPQGSAVAMVVETNPVSHLRKCTRTPTVANGELKGSTYSLPMAGGSPEPPIDLSLVPARWGPGSRLPVLPVGRQLVHVFAHLGCRGPRGGQLRAPDKIPRDQVLVILSTVGKESLKCNCYALCVMRYVGAYFT